MFEVGKSVKGKRGSPKIITDILEGEVIKSDSINTVVKVNWNKIELMEQTEMKIKNEHLLDYNTIQVGDIVKVKNWDVLVAKYGMVDEEWINTSTRFSKHMKEYCGKYFLVDKDNSVYADERVSYSLIPLSDGMLSNSRYWSFCPDALEVVSPEDYNWYDFIRAIDRLVQLVK